MALASVVEEALWNLRTVALTTVHDSLMVRGGRLFVDDRLLQTLRRRWMADSRQDVLSSVSKSLRLLNDVLVSYEHNCYRGTDTVFGREIRVQLTNIRESCDPAVVGLDEFGGVQRYKADVSLQLRVKQLQDEIQRVKEACERLEAPASRDEQ